MTAVTAVCILPRGGVEREFRALLTEISRRHSISHAKNDKKGPHISITYDSKRFGDHKISQMRSELREAFRTVKPFRIKLDGVGYFKKPYKFGVNRVVYARVAKSEELTEVYRKVNRVMKPYYGPREFFTFNPHMTLARKDIDNEKFYRIIGEYKDRQMTAQSTVDSIYLMTRRLRKGPWTRMKIRLEG